MSRRWISGAGAVLAGCLGIWFLWTEVVGPEPVATPLPAVPTAASVRPLPGGSTGEAPAAPAASAAPQAAAALTELERAQDLRALHDQARLSSEPAQQHLARRAWLACFPAFIPPAGTKPTVDAFIRALPAAAPDTDQRAAAYRALYRRCEGFMSLTREQMLSRTRAFEEGAEQGAGLSAGEDALRVLLAGDIAQSLLLARRAVASQDAYALGSLREFMYRYSGQLLDEGKLGASGRPDLRSLAFALAACQSGLDCSAQSLTALQMCANAGQCNGNVVDRLLQELGTDADREAALSEARRVAQAVRAGDMAALGLAPR